MIPDRLIDGYNLMHAAGLARARYGPGDLERCRARFLKRLASGLTEEERTRTTVVFDGNESTTESPQQSQMCGLTIHFSRADEEADDLIERLIQAHGAPGRLLVISGDRRLQAAARRRKAKFVTSAKFWDDLETVLETDQAPEAAVPPPPQEKPESESLSPAELEEWLDYFNKDGQSH